MNNFYTSLLGSLTSLILVGIVLFSYNNPVLFLKIIDGICYIIIILFILLQIFCVYMAIKYIYNYIKSFKTIIEDILCLHVDKEGNITMNKHDFFRNFKTN